MIGYAKFLRGFVLMVVLGFSVACGSDVATTKDPEKLGTLAAAVEKASPEEADRLLAKAGHDETSFRRVVEEIMDDSDSAVKFSEGYNNAGK